MESAPTVHQCVGKMHGSAPSYRGRKKCQTAPPPPQALKATGCRPGFRRPCAERSAAFTTASLLEKSHARQRARSTPPSSGPPAAGSGGIPPCSDSWPSARIRASETSAGPTWRSSRYATGNGACTRRSARSRAFGRRARSCQTGRPAASPACSARIAGKIPPPPVTGEGAPQGVAQSSGSAKTKGGRAASAACTPAGT